MLPCSIKIHPNSICYYAGLMASPQDIFGSNYEALVKLKAKYDPDNIFHTSYRLG
jgi:FAD/FMN-containing dehydrogenase